MVSETASKSKTGQNVLNNDVETAEASSRVVRPCRIALFRFLSSSEERNSHALLRFDIHMESVRAFSNKPTIPETTVPRDTCRVTIAPSLEETIARYKVVAVKAESIRVIGVRRRRAPCRCTARAKLNLLMQFRCRFAKILPIAALHYSSTRVSHSSGPRFRTTKHRRNRRTWTKFE